MIVTIVPMGTFLLLGVAVVTVYSVIILCFKIAEARDTCRRRRSWHKAPAPEPAKGYVPSYLKPITPRDPR